MSVTHSNSSYNEKTVDEGSKPNVRSSSKMEAYEVAPDDNEPYKEVIAGEKQQRGLSREMKNRHIAMISIGGVIGTGLFLVSVCLLSPAPVRMERS